MLPEEEVVKVAVQPAAKKAVILVVEAREAETRAVVLAAVQAVDEGGDHRSSNQCNHCSPPMLLTGYMAQRT